MSNWRVYIDGEDLDLRTFEQVHNGGQFEVARDAGGPYVTGAAINACDTANAAYQLVKAELPVLNGVAWAAVGDYHPVRAAGRVDGEGVPPTAFAEAHLTGRGVLTVGGPNAAAVLALQSAAARDSSISEGLRILGEDEHNWFNLYKVFELLRAAAGGRQGLEALGVEGVAQSSFTAGANRVDVSGRQARHAIDASPVPPKRAMTLEEGQHFIRQLLSAVVQ